MLEYYQYMLRERTFRVKEEIRYSSGGKAWPIIKVAPDGKITSGNLVHLMEDKYDYEIPLLKFWNHPLIYLSYALRELAKQSFNLVEPNQ